MDDNYISQVRILDQEAPLNSVLEGKIALKDYPNIYYNPVNDFTWKDGNPIVILIIGHPGAGKNSVIKKILDDGDVNFFRSATSRTKRDNETDDFYHFMRARKEDEEEKEYFKNLIKEYDLIEYDYHYGFLYGIPRSEIEDPQNGYPLIKDLESQGVKNLQESIGQDYNLISFFVLPENREKMMVRMLDKSQKRRKIQQRIDEGEVKLRMEKQVMYYIQNFESAETFDPSFRGSGLEYSQSTMSKIVKAILSKGGIITE